MPNEGSIFIAETGLLTKLLDEARQLSFAAKELQLIKRRRQRQARKGLVKKSMSRTIKLARRSINKRKLVSIKATRKRNRTKRLFRKVRVFKPRPPKRPRRPPKPKTSRPRKQRKHK